MEQALWSCDLSPPHWVQATAGVSKSTRPGPEAGTLLPLFSLRNFVSSSLTLSCFLFIVTRRNSSAQFRRQRHGSPRKQRHLFRYLIRVLWQVPQSPEWPALSVRSLLGFNSHTRLEEDPERPLHDSLPCAYVPGRPLLQSWKRSTWQQRGKCLHVASKPKGCWELFSHSGYFLSWRKRPLGTTKGALPEQLHIRKKGWF